MKKISTLISMDLRHIFRDKMLSFFLFAPLLILLFVRYFVPYITIKYPVLADFHSYILMFAALQTAILFGFIVSFIFLDEKDENMLQVIRVLPVSTGYFIVYRLSFAVFISFLGAIAMIQFSGLSYPGFTNAILLSLQYSLASVFIILFVATYAKNKVEGMAYFKGVDLLLILPVLGFFIAGAAKYLFGFIPVFWTYLLFDKSLKGESVWIWFVIGMLVYGLVLSVLFIQYKKRVFDR